jgi:WD40 repeat protein
VDEAVVGRGGAARIAAWSVDGPVKAVTFSPEGTRLVLGSSPPFPVPPPKSDKICFWDARTGALVAGSFKGHTASVYSVVFSPGGTRIVSGSGGPSMLNSDHTIRVWDSQTGT